MNKFLYLILLLCFGLNLNAQTFSVSQVVPIPALSVCNDTATFSVTVLTQNLSGSTNNSLTLDLGPGAHYIVGSATIISTNNNATSTMPSITIDAEDASDDNVPVLTISDLAFADQFTLEYKVILDCSVIGQSIALNSILATMSGSGGTKSDNSDQYNASYGVISILPNGTGANQSPNLSFANAVVGQTYTRTIRIRNGGLGYVNSFMFYDTTQIGLTVTPISGGTILSTTNIGNAIVRVYEVNDFTSIGNGDYRFNTNETYEIVQQVQVVSCTMLLSKFGANFGCFGQESCGSTTGTTRLGGASLNPSVQPNIVQSVRQSTILCPDDPRTGYIVLKNTGTDAATNISLTIYKSLGTSASNDSRLGYIDTSSVMYTIYNGGVPTIVDPTIIGLINSTASADGCGFQKPRQFMLSIPLLPAGDSLVVEVDFIGCCNEPCIRNRYIRDGMAFFGSYVNGCGTTPRNITAMQITPRIHLQNEALIEAPTDLNDGDIFDFSIDITRYFFSSPIIPYKYYYNIELPQGIMFSGNFSDIQIYRSNGTLFSPQPPITFDTGTNTFTIEFSNTIPLQEGARFYFSNMMADCSKGSGGGLNVNAYLETDPSCTCKPHTMCNGVNIALHCPGCMVSGLINRGYSIKRVNIGQPDNDNNGIPDPPPATISPLVRDGYAIHCDTLESEWVGWVQVLSDAPSGGFTHGFAIDSSSAGNKLIPLTGRVEITRPGGGSWICDNLPVGSTGLYNWVDFSISNLSACGYGPNFIHGDTIRAYIRYVVADANRYVGVFQYPVKTRFYVSDQYYVDQPFSNPRDPRMWYCDNYSGIYGLAGLYDASNGQRTLTHQSCDTLVTLLDYFLGVGPSQYYGGGNFFNNEYRPLTIYDTFTINIPVGYTYFRATAVFSLNGTSYTLPITPIDANSNPLVFDISQYYAINGGTIPVPDEGSMTSFRTYLVAGCLASANSVSTITMQQQSIPEFKYDHFNQNPTGAYVNNNIISYNKPNITISSAEPVVQASTDTVTWDISLTNTTPFPANNAWLGEVVGGAIEMIDVQEISCSTMALIGSPLVINSDNIYEIGTIGGNAQKCYRITGRITSCQTNDLTVASGWDCNGYPAGVENANCSSNIILYATLLESGLNIQILNQPLMQVELCDTVDYEILIANPNIGRTEDIQVSFTIPGGTAGLEIIPGTSYLKFPSIGGTYPASPNLADPSETATTYVWTIPNSEIGGSGLEGTLNSPNNQFSLKFRARTEPCEARSGIRFFFNANGVSPCGQPVVATAQATQRLNLVGSLGTGGEFVVNTVVDDMVDCARDTALVDVSLLYLGSVSTDGNEKLTLIIPPNYSIVSGSYMPISTITPVSGPTANGSAPEGNIFDWALPAGMVIGDPVDFTIQITKVDTALCVPDSILLTQTSRVFQATCSSNTAIMCDIIEITGDDRDTIFLTPAMLVFNGPLDTIVSCANFNNYLLGDGNYTISGACGNSALSSDIITSPTCLIDGDYTVRWKVSDDCGNIDSIDVIVTVVDTVPPVFSGIPEDVTISCVNDIPPFSPISSITVSDDCALMHTVTITEEVMDSICPNNYVLHRYFIATNECGRMDTATQLITVHDDIKPLWMTLPQDLFVECTDPNYTTIVNNWLTSYGNAMAVDNCNGPVSITMTAGAPVATCGGTTSTVYSVTADDGCGNSITAFADLIIFDNTAPNLVPPANTTISCTDNQATSLSTWFATAASTDGCGGSVIINQALISDIESCSGSISQNILTYLFTATDDCGNVSTATRTFTIQDVVAPIITAPANLTISCGQSPATAILDWLDDYTVTEACQDFTVSNNYTGGLPNMCGGNMTITWTVTDGCGASGTTSAMVIASNDLVPPVFSNCPSNMTVNVDVDICGANVIYSTPVATDCNSPVSVALISGPASGTLFPVGASNILFRATDACGNTADCSFVITVVDTNIPSIQCPTNAVNVCAGTTCTWTSNASIDPVYNDNCPGATISYTISGATTAGVTSGSAVGTIFNLGTSIVTYTVTNGGLSASCSFQVVVSDCTPPAITCPADLVLECAASGNAASIAAWTATATDNCDTNVEISKTLINTADQCGNSSIQLYRFVATDNFGNTSVCYANVDINDTTVPTITTSASPMTVQCDGNGNYSQLLTWLNAHGGAVANDVCGSVTWSNNFSGLSDWCGNTGSTTVIFTVTDQCGNTNTTQAMFTIQDISAPSIVVPGDITLQCGDPSNDVIIANWLSSATGTDVCGSVTISNDYPSGIEGAPNCTGSGTLTVTWTATDACGLTSSDIATITYSDTRKPILMIPPSDLVLECNNPDIQTEIQAWQQAFGNAMAVDACDLNLSLSFTAGQTVNQCGGTSTTPYLFTATDDCGNSISHYANLIIFDEVGPVITLPTANSSVSCDGDIATALNTWLNSAVASDGCGGSTTISYALVSSQTVCNGTTTEIQSVYQFSAFDDCGNISTAFDTFTEIDNVSPTIVAPANLTVACGDDIGAAIIAWIDNYAVTEACQDYDVVNNFSGSVGSLCGGSTTVTWTVTDGCGATGTTSAMIVVSPDNTPPVFANCPGNLFVNVDVDLCGANVIYSTPIANDCNGPVSVALTGGIASGGLFPLGATTITFTATDACSNTSTCSFDIIVLDSDIPQINCPSNDVVVCTDLDVCNWEATSAVNPIAIENCPNASIEFSTSGATVLSGADSASGQIFNLGTTVVTYTITDGSGNLGSCSFNVIVNDCQAPTLNCSDELNIACNEEDLDAWFTTIAATAGDNCSPLADLSVDTLLLTDFSSCGNTLHRVYLFTVTDLAGNTATCTAAYSTVDAIPPAINTDDVINLTLECNDINNSIALIGWLNTNAGLTATDACAEPVSWNNDFNGTLSDLCGNTGAVTVVFTATDGCGNTSTSSAIYTIEDTIEPVISCPPNITVECNSPNQNAIISTWLSIGSGTDDCDESVTITNNYSSSLFDASCGATGTYTVTFTATDDCNNSSSCVRSITIVDSRPPIITLMAIDTTIECGPDNATQLTAWLNNHAGATASDDCSTSAELVWQTPELVQSIQGCGNTVTYIYRFRVADACGNLSAWTLASFSIIDSTDPTITTPASNNTVECDGSGNLNARNTWLANQGGAIASDICGPAPIWTYDLINTIDQCGFTGTYVYRFTVMDACGNTATTEASFIIVDTTNPTITTQAQNMTAQCNGSNNTAEILNWLNNNGFASASEDCGNIIWTNNYGSIATDCGTTGGVQVTFVATDQCGNSSTTSAVFTIIDNIPPTWEIYPQNLTIECNGTDDPLNQINAWLNTAGGGEAKDSCSLVVYTNDFDQLSDGCSAFTGSALVIFTASDACGNSMTATATVTVIDDTGPAFDIMARDTIVECDGAGNLTDLANWLANHGGAVASDECSEPLVWNYSLINTTPSCGNTSSARYSFTATDACGNTSVTTEALFIIVDTTDPVFVVLPQDSTVQCDGNGNEIQLAGWLSSSAGLVADDECGGEISINYDLVRETDLCGLTGNGLYRFTITDACGNTNTAEASFIIVDTLPPSIIGGADINMEECVAPPAGNYPEFDFWLTNHAGAEASDVCGGYEWSDNYNPDNWVQQCGNTRYVDVTFYATDVCGNVDSITYQFSIGDVTPPMFTNCPRPPIVVDAPAGWCSSYVNFSPVAATDNCSGVTITRIDDTGLDSGDLFPVGLTILSYEAIDSCGNKDTCDIKIVVNDYHTPPTITCPNDVTMVNDYDVCGAILDKLNPVVSDNCPDNIAVTYEITDGNGEVYNSGVEGIDDVLFDVGINTVKFVVKDQPILLITEVLQDGIVSGVEVGNFGPTSYNISCMIIRRESSGVIEDFIVPNGTIVPVGGVYTHTFSLIPQGQTATYSLHFLDRVIDAISVNTGILIGDDFIRISVVDHNLQSDFDIADACHAGSFGIWNPGLPVFTDNGKVASLQSADPSMDMCTTKVTVQDIQAPTCMMHDTLSVTNSNIELTFGICNTSSITMPAGKVVDVKIHNLQITTENAGALHVSLVSPSGTEITLFGDLCEESEDVDVTLEDHALQSINAAPCGPLGNGGVYIPAEAFKTFFGEDAAGDWQLHIYLDENVTATIENWTLEVLTVQPYNQPDVVIENDPGLCSAEFTWIHPVFYDNCCIGTMTVTYDHYLELDPLVLQSTSTEVIIGGNIKLDGTSTSKIFPVGITKVIYTLIDQYGNEIECGFDVVVKDTEEPEFTFGCKDREVQLLDGNCTISLGETPPYTDNCGVASIAYCYADGSPVDINNIPIGTHQITIKVTDIYGNVGSCTFEFKVVEFTNTNGTLACNDNINVSLDGSCTAVINADMILEGDKYRCYDNYCIVIKDASGNLHDNLFTMNDVGQTFQISISDCQGSGNSCWGYATIENKSIPQLLCPADTVLYCNFDILERYPEEHELEGQLVLGEVELLNCVPQAKISFVDDLENFGTCHVPRAEVTRRWRVEGQNGNIGYCNQVITFEPFKIDALQFPEDITYVHPISCEKVIWNEHAIHPDSTGWPTLNGKKIFGKHYCDINVGYRDDILQDANCKAAYEILRHWIIRDECKPLEFGVNPYIHIQSIKVEDNTPPTLKPLQDVTISTDPWSCTASYKLPKDIVIKEVCSNYAVKWNVPYGEIKGDTLLANLLKGNTPVSVKVTDSCGNVARTNFNITVIDAAAPVAISKQNIVVSLTSDLDGGIAKLYAYSLDDGSYDNCSEVRLEIRRKDGGTCGNIGADGSHNNNSTFNGNGYPSEVPGSIWFHPDDSKYTAALGNIDTDNGEYVKFCCEDIPDGETYGLHDVEMRVWDDGNMNGIYGDNLIINGMKDNYNSTWVTVRVENKLAPILICPPDITLSCDTDIQESFDGKTNIANVDLMLTGYPVAKELCGNASVTYKDEWVGDHDDVCRYGTIRRTFEISRGGILVKCQQLITLTSVTGPFSVSFPQNGGTSSWERCSLGEDDANDLPIKPIVSAGPCDLVGENIKIDTFVNENGACKKWRVTFSYINWCTHEELGPYYHYYLFTDDIAPKISCADQEFDANPSPANPNGECSGDVMLMVSGRDSLVCAAESWLKWQGFIDLWADGTTDRIATSYTNQSYKGIWVLVNRFLSTGSTNPEWTKLTLLYPNITLADQVYLTYVAPSPASDSKGTLPKFTLFEENIQHKVLWKVTDGCGNVDQCSSTFIVKDNKPPTPYCVSIASALMDSNQPMVELWASDFNKASFDNCTPTSQLYYTFDGAHPVLSNINNIHYYSGLGQTATANQYITGQAYKWDPKSRSGAKIFTNTGEIPVIVSVWDANWNTDYCTVTLQIALKGNGFAIRGNVSTEMGTFVDSVGINISTQIIEYPKRTLTNVDGNYEFLDQPQGFDFTLTPDNEGDHRNGVSTIDLVMIQRHILAVEPLPSLYKMIAADANNDGKISVSDLSELRKLILGINSKLPNNSCYRLPVKNQTLVPDNPWLFEESIGISDLSSNVLDNDFVIVKVGDVNNNAVYNAKSDHTESRTSKEMQLYIDGEILCKKGETIKVPFYASNAFNVYGFQWSMKTEGLKLIDIQSDQIQVSKENVGFPLQELLTLSYASDQKLELADKQVLFTIEFYVTSDGLLSDMLGINSDFTANEAYFSSDLNVGYATLSNLNEVDLKVDFLLQQNIPNPFTKETRVECILPDNGIATFVITDVNGRICYQNEFEGKKGINTILIESSHLNNEAGVFNYRLTQGEFSATRKMIHIK